MIDRITVQKLRIPLTEPYELSFTRVDELSSIFVSVGTDAGTTGLGEVTTLDGYSNISVSTAWEQITSLAPDLLGKSHTAARKQVEHASLDPFAQGGLSCGIETVDDFTVEPVTAPVVGILSANASRDQYLSSFDRQREMGYTTFKVKIGFDPATDAERVQTLADRAPTDVRFRVDANQGYSLTEAREFLSLIDTPKLQLLEQPLQVGDLTGHRQIREEYDTPIMLDEEVRGSENITAIAETGAADFVKFKLMKQGGITNTIELAELAARSGLGVVLGNGVQSSLGCVQEALVWKRAGIETVGEFNGWLKQAAPILSVEPTFADGQLIWEQPSLSLCPDAVDSFLVQKTVFE